MNVRWPTYKRKTKKEKSETAGPVCLSAQADCQLKRRVLSSSGRCPACHTGRWTCWWTDSYCCRSWWWCLSRPWGPRRCIAAGEKKGAQLRRAKSRTEERSCVFQHSICAVRAPEDILYTFFLKAFIQWTYIRVICYIKTHEWDMLHAQCLLVLRGFLKNRPIAAFNL